MNKISAEILTDSINQDGVRLTTFELLAPKFLDAQFEKHRMLSSNSSSSRAIPTKKLIEQVRKDPFVPIKWLKNESGMQGYTELTSHIRTAAALEWTRGALDASKRTETLLKQGVHKQTANRVLEPYLWQKKVVTATEWDNFFNLRLAEDSQPEIQELARCMKEAMDNSTPNILQNGQWHTPYVGEGDGVDDLDTALKVSVARCARVSYNNHDGSPTTIEKDLALYNMLLESRHLSCFEHQASPMSYSTTDSSMSGETTFNTEHTHISKGGYYWSGNFKGWIQYRQLVD